MSGGGVSGGSGGDGTGPEGGAVAVLAVEGMHCPSCAALLREVLVEDLGVLDATVDLDAGRASVRYDPAVHGVDDLCAAVVAAGYGARAEGPPGPLGDG